MTLWRCIFYETIDIQLIMSVSFLGMGIKPYRGAPGPIRLTIVVDNYVVFRTGLGMI